ncbi:hypothetical protein [Epilithonimonas sp.]|uniref:hypothetical protein n=1 Tax=Epilithonimonas sp. TaxID=2894511 RepID=UPI002FDEE32D
MDPMEIFFESPLYQKAEEIDDTLKSIAKLIPEKKVFLVFMNGLIIKASGRITHNLIKAEENKRYDRKMYSAALVRSACLEISGLGEEFRKRGFSDSKYFSIVDRQIEEFRILFLEWVASFDSKQFITDKWGIFNPPGISIDHIQNPDDIAHLLTDDDDDDNGEDIINKFLGDDDD